MLGQSYRPFHWSPPLLLWLVLATNLSAQEAQTASEDLKRQSDAFLPHGSELFKSRDSFFEALLSEPLALLRRTDAFDLSLPYRPRLTPDWVELPVRWPDTISVIPAISLRMTHGASRPIRHPSYHPQLALQWLSSHYPDGVLSRLGWSQRSWVRVNEFHLTIAHHSNGQDGCFFVNQERDGEECLIAEGESPGPINTVDGSFSTNYWNAGFTWRWARLGEDASAPEAVTDREWSVRGTAQWHFDMGDAHLFEHYGRLRLATRVEHATTFEMGGASPSRAQRRLNRLFQGRFLFSVEGTTVRVPDTSSSFIWNTEAAYQFRRQGGWGLFVRNYQGQDYYNILFGGFTQRWEFGVLHRRQGFLRFKMPDSR